MKPTDALIVSLFTATVLSGCATTTTVQENPATAQLEPMEKPELIARRFHQIDKKKDEERYYDHLNIKADGTYTGRTSDGCSWEGQGDLVAPAVSWTGCGSGEWASGENRNLVKKGEIWPLSTGKTVSYQFTQFNARGDNKGSRTRKCNVVGQFNIAVAYGNVDTYKVQCVMRNGNWSQTQVWYFSPKANSEVKYVNSNSSDGIRRDHELTRTEPL